MPESHKPEALLPCEKCGRPQAVDVLKPHITYCAGHYNGDAWIARVADAPVQEAASRGAEFRTLLHDVLGALEMRVDGAIQPGSLIDRARAALTQEAAPAEAGSAELRRRVQVLENACRAVLGFCGPNTRTVLTAALETEAPQPAWTTDGGFIKAQPAPATGTDVCQTCKGIGKHGPHVLMSAPPQQKPCPACNGTGKATACPPKREPGGAYGGFESISAPKPADAGGPNSQETK